MKPGKFRFIAAMAIGLAQYSNAQWEQTHLPYATKVRSLFATDKYFYMSDDYNIYISADSCRSWISSDLAESGSARSILLRNQKLLAVVGGGAIKNSDNYGYAFNNTWRVFNGAKSLVYLSGATNYIFVNSDNGVYRSKDGGEEWESAPDSGLTDKKVLNISASGQSLIAHSRDSGFFISRDKAVHWEKMNSGLPIDSTGKIVTGEFILEPGGDGYYSTAKDLFILNTTNGLHQWANNNLKLPGIKINCVLYAKKRVAGVLENKIFFGTDSGLFKLLPFSLSQAKEVPIGTGRKKITTLVQQGDYVYAGTETGLYRVAYSDSNWESVSNGNVVSLRSGKTALFAGTRIGVHKATPEGKAWAYSANGPTDIMAMATKGDTVMVAGNGGDFNVSGDFGATWEMRKESGGIEYVHTDMLATDSCIFLSQNHFGGIARSCDGGRRWTDVNNGLIAILSSYNVNVGCIGTANKELFISSSSTSFSQFTDPVRWSGLYRSKNNGASWSKSDSGIVGWVQAFAFDGTTLYVGTDNSGIFSSSDGGSTWKKPGSTVIRNVTDLISVGDFVVASSPSGVYASRDKGMSWTSIAAGLLNRKVNTLAASETYLFAGTNGHGVYRLPLSILPDLVVPAPVRKIRLSDKFKIAVSPGSIVLSLRLDAPSLVRASIYEMSGTRVAAMVKKNYSPGMHEVTWSTSNLPQGCFLIRVFTDSESWSGIFVNSK